MKAGGRTVPKEFFSAQQLGRRRKPYRARGYARNGCYKENPFRTKRHGVLTAGRRRAYRKADAYQRPDLQIIMVQNMQSYSYA